jgi:Flp pilus assembly pilin Flp
MNWMTRLVIKAGSRRGQTMTEYALLLATVAAIAVSLFQTSGTILHTLVNSIDSGM